MDRLAQLDELIDVLVDEYLERLHACAPSIIAPSGTSPDAAAGAPTSAPSTQAAA